MVKAAGIVCLVLAALIYAIPLPMINATPPDHDGGQERIWGLILTMLALWFLLTIAMCASVANGGLDWLASGNGGRYTLALLACLAMAVVTGLSGILRTEKVDQIPWAMRPFTPGGWAMWLFPLVTITFCALPRTALRWPMQAVGALSLLIAGGLLTQWFVSSQQRQAARVDAMVAEEDERTRKSMDEVRALDPQKDLLQLLGYTNKFHEAPLRNLALERVRTLPDLEDRLIGALHTWRCEEVLVFLDGSEPPDRKPLLEPVRDSFGILAGQARDEIRADGILYPETFEFQTRLMMSVADKFRGLGVDYAPSIRAYRAVLDEPNKQKLKFNCAATLDDWLARDAKKAK